MHASRKGEGRLSDERGTLPAGSARLIRRGDQAIRGFPLVTGVGVAQMGKSIPTLVHFLADRRGISVFEAATLVPIGIDRRLAARCIEFGKLSRSQVPADGAQILA